MSQSFEKKIKEALSRYDDGEQVRFFVNKGDVFQVGVTHLEEVSLGDLEIFCKKHGLKWEIVSDGLGVIFH